jgi:hypothetical protein
MILRLFQACVLVGHAALRRWLDSSRAAAAAIVRRSEHLAVA